MSEGRVFPSIPPDVSLKEHLNSRFDGLEKLIDLRFLSIEATVKTQNDNYSTIETRVSSLERWRAYTCGACLILGFLVRWAWEKMM